MATFDPAIPAIVCVDAKGAPLAVFQAVEITQFLHVRAAAQHNMLDLGELTVADLVKALQRQAPLALAIDELKRPGIRAVVVIDAAGGAYGAILRAHRRY